MHITPSCPQHPVHANQHTTTARHSSAPATTLDAAKRAHHDTVVEFFNAHNVRRPKLIERRIAALEGGNKCRTHWRFIGPTFPRQTFIEWVGETVPQSIWAKAFYESRRAKGTPHQVILRALAFKWLRIFWRCWHDRQPYDEARLLLALRKRNSPFAALAPQSPEFGLAVSLRE